MTSPVASRVRLDTAQHRALRGADKLLRHHGREREADWLGQQLSQPLGTPTIVVVGEVKRGKSSLVNALVGREVTPVGVDVVTAGFVRVVPPGPDLPEGTARVVLPDHRTRDVDVAQLRELMSVDGAGPDEERPTRGDVAVTARWLPGVVLVDTPGVAGLTSAHARLAALAAEQAGVLLFVSDGGQVLTAPELAFLERVSSRVDSVVLVLSKKDRHPSGWREVLAENRSLLRQHAPRFADAPVLPVSASLSLEAWTADDEVRPLLEEASGLAALAEVLMAAVADRSRLAVANAMRTGVSGLNGAAAQVEELMRAFTGGPEVVAELTEERARLESLREQQERRDLDLHRDLERLRAESSRHVAAELDAIRHRWTDRIDSDRGVIRAAARQRVVAELDSDLQVLAADVVERFGLALSGVVHGLFLDAEAAAEVLSLAPDDLSSVRLTARQSTARVGGVFDPMTAASGLGMVSRLGAGAMGAGALGAGVGGAGMMTMLFNPVTLTVAAGWVAYTVAYKGIRQGRAHLTATLRETLSAARADLDHGIGAVVREIRPEITLAYKRHLTAAVARYDRLIKASDEAARQSATERARQTSVLERELSALRTQQSELEDLLRQNASQRPGTSAAAAASNL